MVSFPRWLLVLLFCPSGNWCFFLFEPFVLLRPFGIIVAVFLKDDVEAFQSFEDAHEGSLVHRPNVLLLLILYDDIPQLVLAHPSLLLQIV